MRPLYIFDIDGTLCNIEHRLHFLNNTADKERWTKFYNACSEDIPNKPVIQTLEALWKHNITEIWLFSGRSEEVRGKTVNWLHKHTPFRAWNLEENPHLLTMRPANNFTEDHLLKQSWLHGMLLEDRERLVAVVEDRRRVVDMWRANGVACFQVADGEF